MGDDDSPSWGMILVLCMAVWESLKQLKSLVQTQKAEENTVVLTLECANL